MVLGEPIDQTAESYRPHVDLPGTVGIPVVPSAAAHGETHDGDDHLSFAPRPTSDNPDLSYLVEAVLDFGRTLDWQQVLVSTAHRLREAAEADACDIYALQDGVWKGLVGLVGETIEESFAGTLYPVGEFYLRPPGASDQEPVEILDVESDHGFSEAERQAWRSAGHRSGLLLPLVAGGCKVGEALLYSQKRRHFDHLELLQGLAQLGARAIANAAVHRELEDRSRRAALVNDSSYAFSSSLEPKDIFFSTALRLCEAIDIPSCDVLMLSEVGELTSVASVTDGQPDDWQGQTVRLADWSSTRLAVQSRSPITIVSRNDGRLSEIERLSMEHWHQLSCLTVPLVVKEKVIGVVELLETRRERSFSADEIATVESVARMAALAIDNAQVYRSQEQHLGRLAALLEAGRTVNSSVELDEVLASVAQTTTEALSASNCTIFVYEASCDALARRAVYSLLPGTGEQRSEPYLISDDGLRGALLGLKEVCEYRLTDGSLDPARRVAMQEWPAKSVLLIPLRCNGEFMGLMALAETTAERHYSAEECELAGGLGEQAAAAIDNARHHEEARSQHLAALEALSSALNAKDPYTSGHAIRVAAYMALLGQQLGWPDERVAQVQEAAYLHDIGKIGVSDRALLKTGPLNSEEWALMRQHPTISAEIVRPLFDDELVAAVRHHHERFDGGGYPAGLAGEEIPLLARAMCVADCYDAMSYERPYRRAFTYAECLAELERCAGAQFDPQMVEAFAAVLELLNDKRGFANAVARQTASLINPEKHVLLRCRADEARPEYRELVATLREVRDANPPVRFLCTYSSVAEGCIIVCDAEEDPGEVSHIGERWFADDGVEKVLSGGKDDGCVLFADQWGVWISGIAAIVSAGGSVVGAVSADVPALESSGLSLGRDPAQAFSSVLQAAGVGRRPEIDAISDGLTGLYNHTYLHEHLMEALDVAERQGGELSLLFVDIDELKRYNELAGHAAGDEALRAIARLLESCTRRGDLVARYGDDEFAAVLVDAGLGTAREVAERLQTQVAALGDDRASLTVSVGIASYPADAGVTDELLERARRRCHDRVVSSTGETVGVG